MKIEKDKPRSLVRVTARHDGKGSRSKSLTVYESTPAEVIEFIRAAFRAAARKGKR